MLLYPGSEINPSEMLQRYAVAVGQRMPLLGLELLLWGTLFSLLLRRVLVTAVLGVAVGSINFAFARGWYSHLWGDDFWIAPELVATTVAVALADVWLGINWFREKRERRRLGPTAGLSSSGTRELEAVRTYIEAGWSDSVFRPSRLTTVGRLVWQHWRESWRLAAVLIGATILPLVMLVIEWVATGKSPITLWFMADKSYDPVAHVGGVVFGIFPAFLGVSLLGLIAFHADQWGRGYRFLADRGAAPKDVWLSRQLVCWGSAAATLPALLAAALFLAPSFVDFLAPTANAGGVLSVAQMVATTCAWVIGFVILSVAAGQLCSMFFHSGILAGLFSIILTLVLAGWCALMWLWQVNWLWSMLPIPIALLLATRLRTRDWLVERNTFHAWLRPGLVLAIPTIALLTAVPLYRIYQIPLVDPGFSPTEFDRPMTPEERTTFEEYGQAAQMWDTSREEALAIALKASRVKSLCILPEQWLVHLARSLLGSATELEREGKLDEALGRFMAAIRMTDQLRFDFDSASYIGERVYDRLLIWAAQPGQTPEQILTAIRQLERIAPGASIRNSIILRHMAVRQFLEGESDYLYFLDQSTQKGQLKLAIYWRRIPWERARCLRLLNLRTRNLIDFAAQLDREAKSGERLWRHGSLKSLHPTCIEWISPNAYTLESLIFKNLDWNKVEIRRNRADIETLRRSTRIVLALEAWKLQHGSLPKKLDELVGACINHLPNDPYTGEPFLYFPNGLPTSFTWQAVVMYPGNESQLPPDCEIKAHKPFLWSAGPNVRPREFRIGATEEPIIKRYLLMDESGDQVEWREPATETEIWAAGRPFPIP